MQGRGQRSEDHRAVIVVQAGDSVSLHCCDNRVLGSLSRLVACLFIHLHLLLCLWSVSSGQACIQVLVKSW